MERRPLVLVVDDVAYTRDVARLALMNVGRVVTARSTREALARARAERPDLVVADLDMPDEDGAVLCRELRSDPELQRVPVVLFTSHGDAAEHARAVDAGAADVLAKPIERPRLVATARRFVRREGALGLPRVEIDAPAEIEIGAARAAGRVRNVSRGGAFVQSELPLIVHGELALEFTLPETDLQMTPRARVMWMRRQPSRQGPAGAGVRFVGLDARSASRIDDWVQERTIERDGEAAVAGGNVA